MPELSTFRGVLQRDSSTHRRVPLNSCAHTIGGMETNETQIEAGRRIQEARRARKLTQTALCELIPGLIPTRLSNWETGRRMVSVDEAKRLASVLQCSAAYLLTLEDDAKMDEEAKRLLELYRGSDARGRSLIFRVAEQECDYAITRSEDQKRAS